MVSYYWSRGTSGVDQLELTMHEVVSYHTKVSIYKLEKVCMCVASFETFGSGSFGGPLGGPVGFGGPLGGPVGFGCKISKT